MKQTQQPGEKGKVEELMKPRVRCKGNGNFHFPGSIFKPGEVLDVVQEGARLVSTKTGGSVDWLKHKNYPHLFQVMQWWEERTHEEFLSIKFAKVIKYTHYWLVGDIVPAEYIVKSEGRGILQGFNLNGKFHSILNVEPATETEYNDYKKLNQ